MSALKREKENSTMPTMSANTETNPNPSSTAVATNHLLLPPSSTLPVGSMYKRKPQPFALIMNGSFATTALYHLRSLVIVCVFITKRIQLLEHLTFHKLDLDAKIVVMQQHLKTG